jgi:hypothetical protein
MSLLHFQSTFYGLNPSHLNPNLTFSKLKITKDKGEEGWMIIGKLFKKNYVRF